MQEILRSHEDDMNNSGNSEWDSVADIPFKWQTETVKEDIKLTEENIKDLNTIISKLETIGVNEDLLNKECVKKALNYSILRTSKASYIDEEDTGIDNSFKVVGKVEGNNFVDAASELYAKTEDGLVFVNTWSKVEDGRIHSSKSVKNIKSSPGSKYTKIIDHSSWALEEAVDGTSSLMNGFVESEFHTGGDIEEKEFRGDVEQTRRFASYNAKYFHNSANDYNRGARLSYIPKGDFNGLWKPISFEGTNHDDVLSGEGVIGLYNQGVAASIKEDVFYRRQEDGNGASIHRTIFNDDKSVKSEYKVKNVPLDARYPDQLKLETDFGGIGIKLYDAIDKLSDNEKRELVDENGYIDYASIIY